MPPSAENPESMRINMLKEHKIGQTKETPTGAPKPSPASPKNPLVFDLAAVEQRLIASY